MTSYKYIMMTGLLTIALSCSVKEDRSACLCCLGVDYSECTDESKKLVLIGWDGTMTESFRDVPEQKSDYREFYVPRCEFTLSASIGADIVEGKYALVSSGKNADSLYACSDRFITDGEYCFRKLELSKQFATIRIITVEGSIPQGKISLRCNSVGISLSDLSPVPGEYSCTIEETPGGVYPFRLYRQGGEIELVIPSARIGGAERILNLSEVLSRSGYDWKETSLRDVDLYLDKSFANISVCISDWNYAQSINVEI